MEETPKKIKLSPDTKKKLDRIVLGIFLPVVAAGALFICFFSAPKLTMGDGYLFGSAGGEGHRSVIYSPGGDILLGPAEIRLWGAYPIVYGTTDLPECSRFILDLEEHTFRKIPQNANAEELQEFDRTLAKYNFQLSHVVDWHTLFGTGNDPQLRRALKDRLSCPARRMFTGFGSEKK